MANDHSTAGVRTCHDCKNPAAVGLTRCDHHHRLAMERAKRWRKANPDRVAEQKRATYERNRDKVKARSRAWTAANKERKAKTGAAWARANPDKVLNSRVKRFGLTSESYKAMLEAQGNRCAICGTDKPGGRGRFAVDHDHVAQARGEMVVRGLLCSGCNQGIGHSADNAEALQRAAQYVRDAGFGNTRT